MNGLLGRRGARVGNPSLPFPPMHIRRVLGWQTGSSVTEPFCSMEGFPYHMKQIASRCPKQKTTVILFWFRFVCISPEYWVFVTKKKERKKKERRASRDFARNYCNSHLDRLLVVATCSICL